MQKFLLVFLLLLFHYGKGELLFKGLYKNADKRLNPPVGADVGDPLILTPFIEKGLIKEGQQAALVDSTLFQDVTSYSGYFTVDKNFNSNMWFWYFPSAGNVSTDPVVLWLNGGPGSSSLFGLFDENGPFIMNNDNNSVILREYSWANNHSVIFVDQPVGTGYSFTNGGYAENETKIGTDMYSTLYQFFQLFPDLQANSFYISGESYAGKFLPAIGYTILKNNPNAELKLNLQGILIGDGWMDPINQMNLGPLAYNAGIVPDYDRDTINELRDNGTKLVKAGDWVGALAMSGAIVALIGGNGNVNVYNFLKQYDDTDRWEDFINTEKIRKALHVGDTTFGDDGVGINLIPDQMQTIAPWLEELLDNYRVMLYTGQLDIICAYPGVLSVIQHLNFTGAEYYKNEAWRQLWFVDGEHAGYVRTGGNLVELMIRDSGHFVPKDQPKWAFDMLYRFTRNIPFA